MSSFLKLAATTASLGVGVDGTFNIFTQFVQLPVWTVPVTSFGAAAVGAGLSLFFGEPLKSKRDLWGQLLAACIFGTAASVLLTDAFGLGWAAKHPGMFAMVIAAMVRWFLPACIERAKQIIREYRLSLVPVNKEIDQ